MKRRPSAGLRGVGREPLDPRREIGLQILDVLHADLQAQRGPAWRRPRRGRFYLFLETHLATNTNISVARRSPSRDYAERSGLKALENRARARRVAAYRLTPHNLHC